MNIMTSNKNTKTCIHFGTSLKKIIWVLTAFLIYQHLWFQGVKVDVVEVHSCNWHLLVSHELHLLPQIAQSVILPCSKAHCCSSRISSGVLQIFCSLQNVAQKGEETAKTHRIYTFWAPFVKIFMGFLWEFYGIPTFPTSIRQISIALE